MTADERIKEISRICGMSEAIVRAVLKAETETVSRSILAGQNAVLLGRCIIKPRRRGDKVYLSCSPSHSLSRLIEENQIDLEAIDAEPAIKHIAIEQLEELL
jgi:hypothetical protein